MTTRVIVTTSGYPARITIQRRNPSSGVFEDVPGSPIDVPADTWRETWVPDNGEVVVYELPKESA